MGEKDTGCGGQTVSSLVTRMAAAALFHSIWHPIPESERLDPILTPIHAATPSFPVPSPACGWGNGGRDTCSSLLA